MPKPDNTNNICDVYVPKEANGEIPQPPYQECRIVLNTVKLPYTFHKVFSGTKEECKAFQLENIEEVPTIDLKERLQEYIPSLFKLLDKDNFPWAKINREFEIHLNKRKDIAAHEGGVYDIYYKDITFFDIISEFKKGERFGALVEFSLVDNLFEQLSEKLTEEGKKKIRKSLIKILTQLQYNFRHTLGELIVLNKFLQSGSYDLESLDYPFPPPSKKDADFALKDLNDGRILLVELVHNQLPEPFPEDFAEIKTYLTDTVLNKIAEKTEGFVINNPFFTVLFVLGKSESLRKINVFFKAGNKIEVKDFVAVCAHVFREDKDGIAKHFFGRIDSLFD